MVTKVQQKSYVKYLVIIVDEKLSLGITHTNNQCKLHTLCICIVIRGW